MSKRIFHQFIWSCISPTALMSLVTLFIYLFYRFRCVVKAQKLADDFLFGAWFYLTLELITLVPDTLPYVVRILAVHKPKRTKQVLLSGNVPTVDVLITCCNEDIDIIINTVRAACVLDYPQDRFRVFVCDDGASSELEAAVEKLNFPNVFYNARIKGLVKDYKAGNLNSGLAYSKSIPFPTITGLERVGGFPPSGRTHRQILDNESPSRSRYFVPYSYNGSSSMASFEDSNCSEYVAGLDADMIPEPHWLRALLPHLINDPALGMACPPQTFYDIPENDPLTQTMDHFAGITEIFNDVLGHADCLGSGYVMRRSAIASIGGFPVESLSEDVCCSATLLGAGWKTAFIHETLQYGSVPESLFAHIKQRTRWFVGHVQTAMLFKLRFFGSRGEHLSLLQRIAGLAFDLSQILQIPILIAYFSIPYALLSGYPVVMWTDREDLKGLMRCATIWMLCHWMHQGVVGLVAGLSNGWYDIRMPSYGAELDRWLAPYIAISFFRSFVLPERWGGKKAGFTSTGSLRDDLKERDGRSRAPLHRRLYVSLISHHLIIHVIFLVVCLLGVVLTLARALAIETSVPNGSTMGFAQEVTASSTTYLVERIGWPPLIWLQYVTSAMCPVLYVIFPPTNQERESMLIRDEKTGVAYPTEQARKPRRNALIIWRYLRPVLAMLQTTVLLTMSFWI